MQGMPLPCIGFRGGRYRLASINYLMNKALVNRMPTSTASD
jgi:hypothetical protein